MEDSYYAVIFTSKRSGADEGYGEMTEKMIELAKEQEGFLGIESARNQDGTGITVSYWANEESIRKWKANSEHRLAQKYGKEKWYENYHVRIARVERDYDFYG